MQKATCPPPTSQLRTTASGQVRSRMNRAAGFGMQCNTAGKDVEYFHCPLTPRTLFPSRACSSPVALSRLVEFMMIDEDGDGTIAFDEAAKMFRNRYGE
eukprot:COSAG02_NODE_809_length_16922_cov_11.295013_6_plen_99_part_00